MSFPLLANMNSTISLIAILGMLIVVMGILMKKIHQPYLIAYILIGVIIGEHGLGFINNDQSITFIGELGIILLFFFIGMEINLIDFLKKWKVALFGTSAQILLSVALILGLGEVFGWNHTRSIVLGFVIALSSSAVVIKLLEEKELLDTNVGKNVLSILLTQDIAIAPILIITSFLGGEAESLLSILLKVFGGMLIVGTLIFLYIKKTIHLPLQKTLEDDHELQVFMSIFFCFAGALLTSLFGLSPALGAFVGGMIIHAGQGTDWIHDALHSFRVIFVAIFFLSIGVQINLEFIYQNLSTILAVLVAVYLTNHFINTVILRYFNNSWREAMLGGALLAQIGEMSFLVCFTAYQGNIIGDYGYNFAICLISLTLIISPFWILVTEKLILKTKYK